MRKYLKRMILEILDTITQAHDEVKNFIINNEYEPASKILYDCKSTIKHICEIITDSDGKELVTIAYISEYITSIDSILNSAELDIIVQISELNNEIITIKNSVKEDIKENIVAVFLPYKASMWGALESVWLAADKDSECEAYVVPIPYFDRNPDFSLGKIHYEGNGYPSYVPVVDYRYFDLQKWHPDIIYIHNPYDGENRVTSIAPEYYSQRLKEYTDRLVYIPYYVTTKPETETVGMLDNLSSFYNIDDIVVESDIIVERANNSAIFNQSIKSKFVALGSPIVDMIVNSDKVNYKITEDWRNIIKEKIIVLFDLTLETLLSHPKEYLIKLSKTFNFFLKSHEYTLWWRPHPLTESTINSMLPELINGYQILKEKYITEKIGIYDDTPDLFRAVGVCDVFYGSQSSGVYSLFCFAGKTTVSDGFAETDRKSDDISDFDFDLKYNSHDNSDLSLLKKCKNYTGNAGDSIYEYIKECIN